MSVFMQHSRSVPSIAWIDDHLITQAIGTFRIFPEIYVDFRSAPTSSVQKPEIPVNYAIVNLPALSIVPSHHPTAHVKIAFSYISHIGLRPIDNEVRIIDSNYLILLALAQQFNV